MSPAADRGPETSERQQRWHRIEALLDRVLDLPADEAARILDEACAGDAVLRAEVESLLDADRRPTPLLDGAAAELLEQDGSLPGDPLEGIVLGPWRVSHQIGRGGMSTVYLGERADGQYEQKVAIKVLRRDFAAGDASHRFHRERQILATLEHPSIVRIQDGGLTPDGRPYLVMDYIDGERIDKYCDRLRLTVAQRLDLFEQVLDAIQYAHRNLVVHRDIKPANILIGKDGRVRLLDFGIAKLLHNEEADGAGDTRTGVRAMTPEYAAPEQVRGERVTTATDVYALGVLLFELLAGHRPYTFPSSSPWAVDKVIVESEPGRPSDAVRRQTAPTGPDSTAATPLTISHARSTEPDTLRSTLDGDLDAIVLKALRKRPADRYGSVEAFREDLDCYLGGHPVMARQGSRFYALRKFVRRNRWPVAIAATIAALLLGTTILVSIEQARTAQQRELAEMAALEARRESRTAEQVTSFLIELFGGSDPYETLGDSISARVLLERGRQRVDRELVDQPAVRASLLLAIGRVYSNLGRREIADTLIRRSIQLRTELTGEDDEKMAEAWEALAGNFREDRNHLDAHGAYTRALRIRRAIGGDQTRGIASDLAGLAYTHRDTGEPDSTFALLGEAIDLLRSTGDTLDVDYVNLKLGYASALRALKRYDEAEEMYRATLPELRAFRGDRHPDVAISLNNLGFLLRQRGRFDEAATSYREALDIERSIFGENHPQTQLLMQNLASALINGGHENEGLQVLERRLAAARAAWTDDDWRTGGAASGLARAYMTFDRMADAEPHLRFAESVFASTIGRDHPWTIAVRAWIAACTALSGRARQAKPLFDRNLQQLQNANLGPDVVSSLNQLASLLDRHDLTARAEAYRRIAARPGS